MNKKNEVNDYLFDRKKDTIVLSYEENKEGSFHLNINKEYIRSLDKKIKSSLSFISTLAGSQCKRKPSLNNSVVCELTSSIGFEPQCGTEHLSFINENIIQDKIFRNVYENDFNQCWSTPGTATIQKGFSKISLNRIQDILKVDITYWHVSARSMNSGITCTYDFYFDLSSSKVRLIDYNKLKCD